MEMGNLLLSSTRCPPPPPHLHAIPMSSCSLFRGRLWHSGAEIGSLIVFVGCILSVSTFCPARTPALLTAPPPLISLQTQRRLPPRRFFPAQHRGAARVQLPPQPPPTPAPASPHVPREPQQV
jgi:hypothetical protein